MRNKENKGRISQGTAAFLVAAARKDIELFSDYLLSMGYQYDGFQKGKMYGVNWIYVNINSKKAALGHARYSYYGSNRQSCHHH